MWPIGLGVIVVAVVAIVITVMVVAPRMEASAPTTTNDDIVGVLPTARNTDPPSTTRPPPGTDAEGNQVTTTIYTTTTRRPESELLMEDVTEDQLKVPPKPSLTGESAPMFPGARGKTAGWDPCRPIHYIVHLGGGPSNGLFLIQEGIARVEAATGLRFQYMGLTDEVPQWAPPPKLDRDMAKMFAPVFIGWATPQETDIWAHEDGDILGVAAPRHVQYDSDVIFISGFVVLNPTEGLTPGFGPGPTVGNVILHELGHLVGLGHVNSNSELMAPELTMRTRSGFGPGDLAGLWERGAQRGCASKWLNVYGD